MGEANRPHDAQFFIDNLRRKQEVDPSFYFAYEMDDDNSLKHVFWSNTVGRNSYSLFGDVLVFDTTYETNRYCMIFAPFTGVNRHRQSVMFGATLLNNERIESFTWLFMKFLDAMGRQQPQAIITDQNPVMMVAIKQVLDKSIHRFCMWHILYFIF